MKSGYYMDNEYCLWIVYPSKWCEFHLSDNDLAFQNGKLHWMSGDSYSSDRQGFGLVYLGPL